MDSLRPKSTFPLQDRGAITGKIWNIQLFIALFLPLLSPSFQLYPAVVCKESNCSSSIKIQCFLFSLNNKYIVYVFLHFIAHSTNVWLGMATGRYFLKTESSLRFRKLPQLSDLKKQQQQNGMPVTYQLIKIQFFLSV